MNENFWVYWSVIIGIAFLIAAFRLWRSDKVKSIGSLIAFVAAIGLFRYLRNLDTPVGNYTYIGLMTVILIVIIYFVHKQRKP